MHRAGWIAVVVATCGACGNSAPDPVPQPGPGSGSAPPHKHVLELGRTEGSGSAYVTPPTPPVAQLDKIGGVAAGAEDLFAIEAGAIVVSGPPPEARKQAPWFLFDEDPATPFAQLGQTKDLPPLVIALSDQVAIDRVSLDYARDSLADRVPERLRLEISEDGKAWTQIVDAEVPLPPADDVRLLAKPTPGRFVRATLIGAHATQSKDGIQELQELRAYGKRVSTDPAPSATGTYDIPGFGTVHLTQTGSEVTGCIDKKQTRIAGGFDGRVLRFMLVEPAAADAGPVAMTFGAGRAFVGFWSGGVQAHAVMDVFDGAKTSDKPGACPGDGKDAMAADLAAGRARLYGVVFDSESDKLRDDAKPALDRLAALMKAQPKLAIRIEAHTDAVATPPHNLILAGKQAVAVRQYLVAAGIDAKRIAMKAMGATEAIAPNSTPLGRAHNRRIEIIKT